jgi:sugar phosphate isomerase/epimerase
VTGIQIGLTVPHSLGTHHVSVDEILARAAALGVSAVELDAGVIERVLGAPVEPALLHPPEESYETGLLPIEEEVFEDELALARSTCAAHVREWRRTVPLGPLDPFRRQYEDAGIGIEIVRWDDLASLSDVEVEYGFRAAMALGARALSTELSTGGPRRLGPFADRHQLFVGFRGQEGTHPAVLEAAFSHGAFIGVSVDIGDWAAGGYGSPLPFLQQHVSRITHVHLTDRHAAEGARAPFGTGDAPIREVLQAMRNNEWPFPAIIALDDDLTEVDRATELARAIAYCRASLQGPT